MEKIKKIRPQDMAMEQIQWIYTRKTKLKPHTQLPERTGVVYNVANESFHSPYSYSTTN